jgi:uroporphyrinogen-III synthase
MPSPLRLGGIRVAVLEARRGSELAELVRRFGGEPYAVPAVRETPRLTDVPAFLDELAAGRVDVVICLTGAAVSRLLAEAQGLDRLDEALGALRCAVTVCRGPKPNAVLRQHGVDATIRAPEPYTTSELLDALAVINLEGRRVAILHYGERNEPLAGALRARGAAVTELCVYEWQLPEDVGPLETLVDELIEGRVQALAVTSQIQCRHLFGIAAVMGRDEALADALRSRVIVAAIGPVCTAALAAHAVTPQVVPSQAKMGFLITALAEYVRSTGGCVRPER